MTSPTTPARPAPTARWSPRQWGLLLVLAATMLVDALEVSVAVTALPAIGADLHLPPATAQWTLTGFAAGFGGLTLLGGRVVARYGRRPVYLSALLVFAAASLLAGAAQGPGLLVATRLVKGLCAALTAPTGLAIIASTFPHGPARTRAVSVYSFFGAGGLALGLLLSGVLTATDWRWAMAFPAPVVLFLFLLALRLVPPGPPAPATRLRPATTAAAAFTAGLLALVYALTQGTGSGGGGPRRAGAALLAAALFGVCAAAERASPRPLLPPGVLSRPAMARSALTAAAMNGSFLGLLLLLTFQLQTRWGWSPPRTALALLPAGLPPALTALLSGRLVARFGAPRLIAGGMLAVTTGYALSLAHGLPSSYTGDVLPTLLCVATGFVLAFTALNTQATAGVPDTARGTAVGVYQTAVQLGAVLVPAATAALLPGPHTPAPAAGRPALLLITAVGALGLLTALTGLRTRPRHRPRPTPGPKDRR